MVFNGLNRLKYIWDIERYETQCADFWSDLFERMVVLHAWERMELLDAGVPPKLHHFFLENLIDSLGDLEKKFQVMRNQGDDIEYMREVFEGSILQYRDFFSPWGDDPVREPIPYLRPVHVF